MTDHLAPAPSREEINAYIARAHRLRAESFRAAAARIGRLLRWSPRLALRPT